MLQNRSTHRIAITETRGSMQSFFLAVRIDLLPNRHLRRTQCLATTNTFDAELPRCCTVVRRRRDGPPPPSRTAWDEVVVVVLQDDDDDEDDS